MGRNPTWTPSPIPPFLLLEGERGKEREREEERGAAPPPLAQFGLPMGGRATSWAAALSLPSGPLRPNTSLGGSGNPSGTLVCTRYTPEPFRCPNTTFQYINLYLSTISRLLVMSVISSRTPNKLRSPKHTTHNTNRHRTRRVRTLKVTMTVIL